MRFKRPARVDLRQKDNVITALSENIETRAFILPALKF
jgi:hypothetical protein